MASEMDRLGRPDLQEEEKTVQKKEKANVGDKMAASETKFSDKMFDGLRDEDREQTEYLDEGSLEIA